MIMDQLPCNCNPPAVQSTIVGKRCHVMNNRGEWCAIINKDGIYLQTLVIPSEEEIISEEAHKKKFDAEQAKIITKETRIQELKNKMNGNEELTLQEITELLKLTI